MIRHGGNGLIAHISDDGLGREESVAEHTEKTTFLCREKGTRCGLSQVMSLCGILHDMGKNKQAFHDYLCADEHTRHRLRGTVAHASTGAKYIYDLLRDSSGHTKMMGEMISYAVAAHHGLFDNVDAEKTDLFSRKLENIDDYAEACRHAEQDYLGDYDLDRTICCAADEFDIVWEKMNRLLQRMKPFLMQRKENGVDPKEKAFTCKFFLFACLQRLMLSILIDSDWEATSDFMGNINTLSKKTAFDAREVFEKAETDFREFMRKKRQSASHAFFTEKEQEIFDARNALQDECIAFAKHPAGIYCLPIPTGGGKTLSSLAYALEYCRLHPETERIIYVSPYISITEQNAKVFRDAVGNSDWVLEHHSSVIRKEKSPDEDYRSDKNSKYEINWEEPFICTTFVQFMNTLFSDKSESIRRMHRLVNAVVIMDEVQSMPLKCVHTFNYMIQFLNAVCNTNMILCTATQPALDEAECPICYHTPKQMIENAADWFRIFDRVKIDVPEAGQKHTFESLGEEIVKRLETDRSILVVLNTKSAVRKLYDRLKEQGVNVKYLTTNLCAGHRNDRIEEIKETLAKKREPIVVISTNLIEAGVDISFACVYRSMAGLDSLAQSAGRCNRNGEMAYGRVCVVTLEGENTGNMRELQQKTRVTENLIRKYSGGGAGDNLLMPRWMDEYYRSVYFYESDEMNFPVKKLDTSMMELLSRGFGSGENKHLLHQAYKTAGREYRVIDDDSFGVIVPYGKGKELIERIQEADNAGEIKAYIRQAQRYTVNVKGNLFEKFAGLIQPVSEKIPGLYMAALPGVYDEDYGIAPKWETLIF
ncbi:MAG: CRISPR-associated helicase Cas3' [bacterium]|nr:CRISPR-associated helicase Cas3' [bacterium]